MNAIACAILFLALSISDGLYALKFGQDYIHSGTFIGVGLSQLAVFLVCVASMAKRK